MKPVWRGLFYGLCLGWSVGCMTVSCTDLKLIRGMGDNVEELYQQNLRYQAQIKRCGCTFPPKE